VTVNKTKQDVRVCNWSHTFVFVEHLPHI
jgi:hypothetical protein